MAFEIILTPGGSLCCRIQPSGEKEDSKLKKAKQASPLEECFHSGNAAALIALASHEIREDGSPAYVFFREIARDFLLKIAVLEEDASQDVSAKIPELAELSSTDAEKLCIALPPFPGAEYASVFWFQQLFKDLGAFILHAVRQGNLRPADWVRSLAPQWKDVGKVCFHLAENKDRDDSKPFVFLATYIHCLSSKDRPKHLPLALALKRFASDKTRLLQLLKPVSDASGDAPFLHKIAENKTLFKPSFFTASDAWNFLKEIRIYQQHGILVRTTSLWKNGPPKKLKVAVSLDLSGKHARLSADTLVKFSVGAAVGEQMLTPEELEKILHSGGGLIRIKGQWIEADTQRVAALLKQWQDARDLAAFGQISLLHSLKILSGASRLSGILPDTGPTVEDIFQVRETPDFHAFLQNLNVSSVIQKVSERMPPLPSHLEEMLRPYQKNGVHFLWNMTESGFGVCLADDMGLGKTVQILSWLELLRLQGVLEELPALLAVPASLLENWKNEAIHFTPDLKVRILHPSAMSEEERSEFEKDAGLFLKGTHLAVTTYTLLPRFQSILKALHFPAIIADEAQAVKNADSLQSRALRSLQGRRRVVMTGTPVENSFSDLWSLFDFIMPGLLGSAASFREFVKSLEHAHNGHADYSPLRKLVRPCILRRLKNDRSILQDLPDKTEVKVYCSLTPIQANFYQRAVDAMKKELELSDERTRSAVVLTYLMQFKQICNHPSQFSGNGDFDPRKSGKFLRLSQLADEIARRGQKVLVFTQFREMTEPLHELLASRFGRPGLILHGGTPVAERGKFVELFQSEDGPPFFVLSLKAAGTGLNLTAASHVIHFDRWWNPAVENQATDRAYRIGQHQNVLVHKFIVRGTIEEKIDSLISGKKFLADSLLSRGAEKLLTEMTSRELLDFVQLDTTATAIETDPEDFHSSSESSSERITPL